MTRRPDLTSEIEAILFPYLGYYKQGAHNLAAEIVARMNGRAKVRRRVRRSSSVGESVAASK